MKKWLPDILFFIVCGGLLATEFVMAALWGGK